MHFRGSGEIDMLSDNRDPDSKYLQIGGTPKTEDEMVRGSSTPQTYELPSASLNNTGEAHIANLNIISSNIDVPIKATLTATATA